MKAMIHNISEHAETHRLRDDGMRAPECLTWPWGRLVMCEVLLHMRRYKSTVQAAKILQTLLPKIVQIFTVT